MATQSKQYASMPSSPPLPSPSQLLSRKISSTTSAMERSSLAKEAVVSFKSASSLLRRSQSADESTCTPNNEEKVAEASPVIPSAEEPIVKKTRRPAKDKKEPMKVKNSKASATKVTSARRTSKNHVPSADIDSITVIVAGRVIAEPRDKKRREPAQTKIKKSKVTKVGSVNGPFGDSELKSKARRSSKIDKEFTEPLVKLKEAAPLACMESQDLCSDDVVRRRSSWTPVKDTGNGSTIINSERAQTQGLLDQDTPVISKRINNFENLAGDYGYTHSSASLKESSKVSRNSTGEALTKRRKIELITTSICPPSEPNKTARSKSPRKKPQTITAKATAHFVNLDTPPASNLLQYLAPDTAIKLVDRHVDHQPMEKKKRRSTTKSTSKAKANSSRTTKASRQAPILLPPDKALEKATEQELLFGTSSQLARDDSPTFIRELQQAMRESESLVADSPQVMGEGVTASFGSGSTNGSNLSLFTASRSLWSAATRDLDGSLQEAEVIDLSKTPRPPPSYRTTDRSVEPPAPIQKIQTSPKASGTTVSADGWTNIDDIASPEHQQQQESEPNRVLHKSLAEAALKNRPKSRSPVKKSKHRDTRPKPPGMPNYEGFSPSELVKQLTAYGLKAPKGREKQITMLESCWESKNRTALQQLEPNVNKPQQKADLSGDLDVTAKPTNASPAKKKRGRPPKQVEETTTQNQNESPRKPSPGSKPRGRPKKESTEQKTPTKKPAKPPRKPTSPSPPASKPPPSEEIPDSDDPETTPRAPPPLPEDFLPLSSPPPTTLTPTTLLRKITEAITTYPPTHDMHNPTFYEKILLYDPIVLEDLAAWLNTEGLRRVGVDEEVRYVFFF
ncbi:MAG: hypothetical protein Q9195_000838 [Heterodermia aff. obscurata]